MAKYGIETENTEHLRGMAFGDCDMGDWWADIPPEDIGYVTVKDLLGEYDDTTALIKDVYLLDIDKAFLKVYLSRSVGSDDKIYLDGYGSRFERTKMYSLPTITMMVGYMVRDGYISKDEGVKLADATGYCTSTQYVIDKIAYPESDVKYVDSNGEPYNGVIPFSIDRTMFVSKGLFPYIFPVFGLYDTTKTYEESVEEWSLKLSLVRQPANKLGNAIMWTGNLSLRLPIMDGDSIIALMKKYYEYLQWKDNR